MLVRPTYKPYWDIPGGYVEPGETPKDACVREVFEELACACRSAGCSPSTGPRTPTKATRCRSYSTADTSRPMYVANIHFGDGEIGKYAFIPPEKLDDFTVPRLANRLRATLAARQTGRPA
jgi:8-oxo-dGTP diphosphatase